MPHDTVKLLKQTETMEDTDRMPLLFLDMWLFASKETYFVSVEIEGTEDKRQHKKIRMFGQADCSCGSNTRPNSSLQCFHVTF